MHSPCTPPPFHIASHISHLTLHNSIIPCRTYSTSHLIPHHSHIRMNKAQHPTSGITKCCTSHQIPRYSTSHRVIWWYWNVVWCGMVSCTGNVVWCEMLCCGGEMWNVWHIAIASLTSLHHSTTFYIASFHIKRHLWHIPYHTMFHGTPSFFTISHLSYHTNTSRSTLCHFAIPYFKSQPHMHHATSRIPFHITPHSMYSTPHLGSPYIGHIMHHTATFCIAHFTQRCACVCVGVSVCSVEGSACQKGWNMAKLNSLDAICCKNSQVW